MTDKEQILLQMYSSHKKKKIIIICIIIALIVIVGIGTTGYLLISSQSFNLSNDTITIEYGTYYNPSLTDFVDVDETVTKDNTSFQCNIENEEGKEYASIGEYDVSITHILSYQYQGKKLFDRTVTKTAKILVTDTTPPIFDEKCPTELTVMNILDDADKPDLSQRFTANDISGVCTISVKDDAVDYKTANRYTVEVVATDNSNNSTTMECVINVVVPELKVKQTEITLELGESSKIEVEYSGAEKPTFESSNTNVVTVDADGKVTSVYAGKCYVTIYCNGLKAICDIIVNPKPVEQPTTEKITERKENQTKPKSTTSSSSSSKQDKTTKPKTTKNYPNKDFLFTDGYTMDNVTEAAYSYLKESGKAGSCIPLKNSEGIYIGMRVVFN